MAGLRAGENRGTVATSNVGPIVQLMSQEPPARERIFPFFSSVPERRHAAPRRNRDDRAARRRDDLMPPAERAPALRGPAGPPPVSFAR
jgi:hypothetical protein